MGAELKNTDSEKKINHPRRKYLDYISAAVSLKQSKQNDLLAVDCSKNVLIRVCPLSYFSLRLLLFVGCGLYVSIYILMKIIVNFSMLDHF